MFAHVNSCNTNTFVVSTCTSKILSQTPIQPIGLSHFGVDPNHAHSQLVFLSSPLVLLKEQSMLLFHVGQSEVVLLLQKPSLHLPQGLLPELGIS